MSQNNTYTAKIVFTRRSQETIQRIVRTGFLGGLGRKAHIENDVEEVEIVLVTVGTHTTGSKFDDAVVEKLVAQLGAAIQKQRPFFSIAEDAYDVKDGE